MAAVIKFENVSKRYRLGSGRESLREALSGLPRRLLGQNSRNPDPDQYIWALKDVSFEVQPGEALGIIGPNGAGKTTILKLLAGITKATSGNISVKGRVASLIELGAGFHPDLTGRENIYLNGAILGLSKREIDRKFDSIVDFSGLEKFIDTPVKRYSSGMYVRLGFAVAAHVEPDVLLVDEVLAVGDIIFQARCLSRIKEVASQGTAIAFVSHNLNMVETLCTEGILLMDGHVRSHGEPVEVVHAYKSAVDRMKLATVRLDGEYRSRFGTGYVRITDVQLLNAKGEETSVFQTGGTMRVRAKCILERDVRPINFGVAIFRADGLYCFGADTKNDGIQVDISDGKAAVELQLQPLNLLQGSYQVSVSVWDEHLLILHEVHERMYDFVIDSSMKGHGPFYLEHRWM